MYTGKIYLHIIFFFFFNRCIKIHQKAIYQARRQKFNKSKSGAEEDEGVEQQNRSVLKTLFRMFRSGVHQQCIATCINCWTQIARIFSRKMNIVMISNVAYNFSTQQTSTPFINWAHLLKQLCYTPCLQLWKQFLL